LLQTLENTNGAVNRMCASNKPSEVLMSTYESLQVSFSNFRCRKINCTERKKEPPVIQEKEFEEPQLDVKFNTLTH
jgi:hypothetical protein